MPADPAVFEAAQVRYNYLADVAQLPADGSYSAARDAIRAFYNQSENSTTLAQGISEMYRWEQGLAGVAPSLANPTATAAAVNNTATIARYGGQGLMVVGVGVSVYNISTDPDPYRATVQAGSSVVGGAGGATVGAWIGGAIGSVVPGPGTAIGAVVGGIIGAGVGGAGGHALGTAAYDANYGPNSPWFH